jgi:adenylate cyclase class 2
MNYEVEVKYRTDDHDGVARQLAELGAAAAGGVEQEDTYLSHPARDFAETKEAFRIRRAGEDNRLTYKGPKQSGPTKTRAEVEIPFAAGDERCRQMARLLLHLGFQPVATIRKRRESFHLFFQGHPLEVALDTAEGLGRFVEIEAIAGGDDDLPGTQQAVLALGERLGLSDVEPRSYLRMLLEARGIAPPAGDEVRPRPSS